MLAASLAVLPQAACSAVEAAPATVAPVTTVSPSGTAEPGVASPVSATREPVRATKSPGGTKDTGDTKTTADKSTGGATSRANTRAPKSGAGTKAASDLADPDKKEIAMELVSSAENSSLDWKAQYKYIEDIDDGRGYTGGIIGFCSGTGDMLDLVELYARRKPGNVLAPYLPALRKVNGTDSHKGLDPNFTKDWRKAAADPAFQQAQNDERDRVYFNPAVGQAKADGLRALGQFIYYDGIVMHGPGDDAVSFGGIRRTAMKKARTPAQGGDEVAYLNAFLDARKAAMKTEEAHSDTSRVDTAQRVFLKAGNLDLDPPLTWKVYGDSYHIGG
ncbi:chitosanase [Planotetraspora thailandica]|nr:chitosanase [Planotetraspora thailandica]